MTGPATNLLLVDDSQLLQRALKAFIQTAQPTWKVDQASSIDEAASIARDRDLNCLAVILPQDKHKAGDHLSTLRDLNPNAHIVLRIDSD